MITDHKFILEHAYYEDSKWIRVRCDIGSGNLIRVGGLGIRRIQDANSSIGIALDQYDAIRALKGTADFKFLLPTTLVGELKSFGWMFQLRQNKEHDFLKLCVVDEIPSGLLAINKQGLWRYAKCNFVDKVFPLDENGRIQILRNT